MNKETTVSDLVVKFSGSLTVLNSLGRKLMDRVFHLPRKVEKVMVAVVGYELSAR